MVAAALKVTEHLEMKAGVQGVVIASGIFGPIHDIDFYFGCGSEGAYYIQPRSQNGFGIPGYVGMYRGWAISIHSSFEVSTLQWREG